MANDINENQTETASDTAVLSPDNGAGNNEDTANNNAQETPASATKAIAEAGQLEPGGLIEGTQKFSVSKGDAGESEGVSTGRELALVPSPPASSASAGRPTAIMEAAPASRLAKPSEAPMTEEDKTKLAECEKNIKGWRKGVAAFFSLLIAAFFQIRKERLHRGPFPSFEAYSKTKWGYRRAHAIRLAEAGAIAHRKQMSPTGDIISLLTTESHYRGLTKLTPQQQDAVIDLISEWVKWLDEPEVTVRMVESAIVVLNPPTGPKQPKDAKLELVKKVEGVVDAIKKELPTGTAKEVRQVLDQIKKKVAALAGPPRMTGIDWTDATWNPLQGCARASAGCDYCYAAKLVATRLADVYPGLASEKKTPKEKGKGTTKTYFFNNVIRLLPEQLGDPLRDLTPRRYFVNSMSDLFHNKVPDEFIEAVFDVMEKAHWHEFQVLTKRPGRMAEFSERYFKDKTPPANIWLGASVENQKALDERYPLLLKVKAAVRWLSCEPLIGPIKFDSLDGIGWVVVGGESGSKRQMEKAWATDIRDACKKANLPFFFKQWGEFGEDGKKIGKKPKKDGLTPPTLDGKIHNAYPQAAAPESAAKAKAKKPRGPKPKKPIAAGTSTPGETAQ